MFEVNGMNIDVDGMQLLQDLKLSLAQNGIFLLNTIKPGFNNIMFSCTAHKDGQEHKPSAGLSTQDVWREGKLIKAGTVHCFACGYTDTLDRFISKCFGRDDGGIYGNKWLKINYRGELVQKKRELALGIARELETTKIEYPTISEELLDTLRYNHPYMYIRGLTDPIIEQFDIGYDIQTNSITFPIRDLKGDVKWILERSINRKFYKVPSGIVKTDFVYGAYECIKEGAKVVYITESVLNALTLWKLGKPSVALLSTGGGRQYDILKKLPFREYVLALDNDLAGIKGQDRLITSLKNHKLLSAIEYEYKCTDDINDLQHSFLDLKKYSINY